MLDVLTYFFSTRRSKKNLPVFDVPCSLPASATKFVVGVAQTWAKPFVMKSQSRTVLLRGPITSVLRDSDMHLFYMVGIVLHTAKMLQDYLLIANNTFGAMCVIS